MRTLKHLWKRMRTLKHLQTLVRTLKHLINRVILINLVYQMPNAQ